MNALPQGPTFWQRFWRRMGYGFRFDDSLLTWRYAEDERFPGATLQTSTTVHFALGDRLRILLSGTIQMHVITKTDAAVHASESRTDVGILPPNYQRPKRQ